MSRAPLILFGLLVVIVVCQANRLVYEKDAKPFVPRGYKHLGLANSDEQVELVFCLKQSNIELLKETIDDISNPKSTNYGSWLNMDEINQIIAPSKETTVAVRNWLTNNGAKSISSPLPDYLVAIMSVSTANRLLGVEFRSFEDQKTGQRIIRALDLYSLPSDISEFVDLVAGVFRFPKTREMPKFDLDPKTQIITPLLIRQMYNVSVPRINATNVQAIASFLEQYWLQSDLNIFQSVNKLPPIFPRMIGNQVPNATAEASLDIQYITGPGNDSVQTWAWYTPRTTPNNNEPFFWWLLELGTYAQYPYVISTSYDDFEDTVSEGYAIRVSNELLKNALRGITFLYSSGDSGVTCSSNCQSFRPQFPSSSPYVLSVGGTTLVLENSVLSEIAVSFSSGGFSNYFERPAFQDTAVQEFLSEPNQPPQTYYNVSGRGFPDLSLVSTAFQVYINGILHNVSGTSASCPALASLLSLINTMRLNANLPVIGYVTPALYAAAQNAPQVFRPITSSQDQEHGCCKSGGFKPTSGWDPITGLGVPNFWQLSQYLLDPKVFAFNK